MERDRVEEAQSWFDEAKISSGEKTMLGMCIAQTELMFTMVELLDKINENTAPTQEKVKSFPQYAFREKTITLSIPPDPLGVDNTARLRTLADELDLISSPIAGAWLRSIADAIDAIDLASSA